MTRDISHLEPLSRHRKIRPQSTIIPEMEETTLITDNSTVVGDVKIGGNSIVWYGSILRGDDAPIR